MGHPDRKLHRVEQPRGLVCIRHLVDGDGREGGGGGGGGGGREREGGGIITSQLTCGSILNF